MSEADVLAVLRSIDASLKTLVSRSTTALPATTQSGPVAPDADLDGPYGNPPVKFNPRDWTGESCKGLTFSECPAEFLDMLAETFDYFARKAEENNETTPAGKLVAPYKRKDAARARGWAARIRAGYKPPTSSPAGSADFPEY